MLKKLLACAMVESVCGGRERERARKKVSLLFWDRFLAKSPFDLLAAEDSQAVLFLLPREEWGAVLIIPMVTAFKCM